MSSPPLPSTVSFPGPPKRKSPSAAPLTVSFPSPPSAAIVTPGTRPEAIMSFPPAANMLTTSVPPRLMTVPLMETCTREPAGSTENESLPGLPAESNASNPAAPSALSAPSPGSQTKTSSPPAPAIVSFPGPPVKISGPLAPVSLSAPGPPFTRVSSWFAKTPFLPEIVTMSFPAPAFSVTRVKRERAKVRSADPFEPTFTTSVPGAPLLQLQRDLAAALVPGERERSAGDLPLVARRGRSCDRQADGGNEEGQRHAPHRRKLR